MVDVNLMGKRNASSCTFYIQPISSSVSSIRPPSKGKVGVSRARKSDNRVEEAIYSHIQAIRALGRTTINTVEIAKALSISNKAVEAAIKELRTKGVKLANHG